jgi:tetratricopeptide (TPR) repeat protein
MANQDDEQGGEHEETEDEASSDEGTREEEERDDEESDDESSDDDAAEAPASASSDAGSDDDDASDDAPVSAPAPIVAPKGKAPKLTAGARVAAAKAAKAAQKAVKKQTYAEERASQTNAPAPTVPDEEVDPVEQIRESPLGQATVRAQEWVSGNQGLVLGVLAVAALAIVGWFGYQAMNDSSAVAAGSLLEEAVEISRAEIRDEDEEASDEADAPRSYASVAERTEAALTAYRRVLSEAGGTPAAGWARLGEGRLLLDSGEPSDARDAFEAAIASHGSDPVVAMRAYEGVGFTYEAEENWDEARESFERIRGLQNGEYAAIADYNLARVRLATGDDVGAQTALEELVDGLREDAASGEPAFPYVLAQAQTLLRELDPSSASGAEAPTLGAGASEEEIMEMIRRAMESRGASAPGE